MKIYKDGTCDTIDCEVCSGLIGPIDYELTPMARLTLDVSLAMPTIPLVQAAEIAAYLVSHGYCKTPF